MSYFFTGIDPGLVDTGVVMLEVDLEARTLTTDFFVVTSGEDSTIEEIVRNVEIKLPQKYRKGLVYVEKYRDRAKGWSTNAKMSELTRAMTRSLNGLEVDNMGVKKLVSQEMLRLFKWQRFPGTNHQDLLSAARILLLGMMRDNATEVSPSSILYAIFHAHLNGRGFHLTS